MNSQRQTMIKEKIMVCMREKFSSYNPETKYMPFHHRLLGKDRMALFSFIQSLNTTFGISIYEPVAIALASGRFRVAKSQIKPAEEISSDAHQQIQTIMDELTTVDRKPNKLIEIEELRSVCRSGTLNRVKLTKVDIWLENHDGENVFYLILKL